MRRFLLPALVVPVMVVAGCGEPAGSPEAEAPTHSGPETAQDGDAIDGPERPDGQPPVDGPLPDTRTGALPMPGAPCFEDQLAAEAPVAAFDGTITAVGSTVVTFEVHEVFAGDVPDEVRIDLGPATTSRRSESGPSYSVGTRLLVKVDGTSAIGCGATRYFDEETAAAWRS
jgi:hypothetical protein